ncbi:hypothetical protein C8F01DRAFT_1164088 [Mycena amicta]|nr:hypothetical protein C8F01DRAFT_1164088 [Mycena amicta]
MAPTSHFRDFFPLAVRVYSSLFFQCIQILYSHRRPNYKLHLGCMFALYFLSTVHIVLAYTWAFITDTADKAIYEVFTLQKPAPIHRCYVIWGCNWKAVALPLVSYVCTIIGGFLDLLPLPPASARAALTVGYGGVFFTNVFASTLAAGRIWYQSRRLAKLMGSSPRQRYMDLTAIILESGLIYPILLIITIVIFLTPTPTVAVLVCIAAAYHVVGIAPTFIIVRVGLGVSTQDTQMSITVGSSSGRRTSKALGTLRFAVSTRSDETINNPVSGWKTP